MAEQTTKGPAEAWTGAVSRVELSNKALASAIKLWDESGSVPRLESLAWTTVEAARVAVTCAQDDEKRAYKRIKDAQSQLSLVPPTDHLEPEPVTEYIVGMDPAEVEPPAPVESR